MTRLALRGLAARKLRSVLTALAIVLGVAMVTGAFVVSDTLLNGSDKLREAAYGQTDAVVAKRTAFQTDYSFGGDKTSLPAATVDEVRALPQVEAAIGDLTREAKIIGEDGKVVGSGPYFAIGLDASAESLDKLTPWRLQEGRFASGPGEVVLDAGTAEKEDISVGGTVRVAAEGPVREYRVVGLTHFGEVDSIGQSTVLAFDLAEAQRIFASEGRVDSVLVDAREGVSQAELNKALASVAPGVAVTGAEAHDRFTLDGLDEFLAFIKTFLIAFGVIAVFVGAFIIFNTLSITVAQRSRELALLRTVGASRRQVLRSVVLEALVLGLAASVSGIAFGLLLATGLMALFASVGVELPETGMVFAARTAIVALVVGTGVTVIAGLVPAIRATRVSPVEALRDGAAGIHQKHSKRAPWIAGGVSLLATALVAYGLFGSGLSGGDRLAMMGAGSLILFIGVAGLSSRLVVPLASLLGRPAERVGGSAGRLARRNAMRNPSRTAVTAAALMIGVALVTFVAVLATGLKESARGTMDDAIVAPHVVASSDLYSPVPAEALEAVARVDGVDVVTGVRTAEARAFGKEVFIGAVDPAKIGQVYRYDWAEGDDSVPGSLGRDGAIVRSTYAEDQGLELGERFELTARGGETLSLTVRGIDSAPPISPLNTGDVTISDQAFDRAFDSAGATYVWVGGHGPGVKAGLDRALAEFPAVEAFTKQRFADEQIALVDSLLGIVYVLLALSVIVSLFGIINTLALSVFERTRELGMLRAVGMTRRQVRRMIRHESIITALIGTALGAAIGVLLGFLTVQALREDGFEFVVPAGSLVAFAVVAIVAGIVAAIGPARRAAKIEPVAALQYE